MAVRSGSERILTLTFHSPSPRTQTYRVTEEDYLLAGSPEEGETLDEDTLLPLIGEEDVTFAYRRALRILSSGDNTCANLLRKLRERGFLSDSAKAAVDRLTSEGYIREEELLLRQLEIYAKRLWGPRRFLPSLLEKGFSRASIESALRKAEQMGIYDKEEVKARLLDALATDDPSARRAWLYKHGF